MINLSSMVPETPIKNKAEADYFHRLLTQFPQLMQEYEALEESKGGKILNTDVARELSPEYRADRTRSADIHEPASEFTKQYFAHKLRQQTPEGKEPLVIFSAGGTGAGKTTAIQNSKDLKKVLGNAEMVYDTNMNKLSSSEKKIQQALQANRKVMIAYTYRHPVEALTGGALPRAMRMERDLGTGRTVPLSEHLKTHIGSRQVIEELSKKYKDNPNVELRIIDNSRGAGKARKTTLDKLPKHDQIKLRKELHDALQREHQEGRISDAVHKGTKDYSV